MTTKTKHLTWAWLRDTEWCAMLTDNPSAVRTLFITSMGSGEWRLFIYKGDMVQKIPTQRVSPSHTSKSQSLSACRNEAEEWVDMYKSGSMG